MKLQPYNIKAHYDKYWKTMSGKGEREFPLLVDTIKELEPKTILEVGCGDGRNLRTIQKHLPEIELYGIDISKTGIEYTREHTQGFFKVADAKELPFVNIDLVLTVHALEQMKYIIKEVIKEIYQTTDKYLLCFEPFFSMQNIFGKWHCIRSEYVQGIPFYVRDAGFKIIEFKKTNMGNFLSKTGMLLGEKIK